MNITKHPIGHRYAYKPINNNYICNTGKLSVEMFNKTRLSFDWLGRSVSLVHADELAVEKLLFVKLTI